MKLIGNQAGVVFGRDAARLERPVAPPLRKHFSKAWHLKIPRGSRPLEFSVLPDGCAELVWSNGVLSLLGPSTTAYAEIAAPGSTSVAVRFRLGAAPAWLGIPAADLVGNRVILDEIDEPLATKLRDAVGNVQSPETVLERLESALADSTGTRNDLDPCMAGVTDLLQHLRASEGTLLRDLQRLTNLSERSVRRETARVFGFGPKTLERVVRFQHFLNFAEKRRGDGLATLAAAAGYSDQSHLTRETRELTGMTPKTLFHFCDPELCY